jgi:hypothetical protein
MMRLSLAALLLLPLLAQSPTCAIEGRVSNLLSGSPVRKAQVVLGTQYHAVTDNNGHYAIAGIAPGRYQLSVQRPGFLPSFYGARGPNRPGKSILLGPGESRKDLNFSLEPPGVITGHIYDQDGENLSTPVILYREIWYQGHRRVQQMQAANSDDEGEYRLFGLAAGNYYVATAQTPVRPASPVPVREVYPATFYPSTEDASSALLLKVAPGSEARNIDIRVRKTTSVDVRGTISIQELTPGLRVTLQRRDGLIAIPNSVMFPQPGRFLAHNLTPGSYVLSAHSNSENGRVELSVGTVDMDDVELRLAPTPPLAGTLKIDGDEPPPGATFALTFSSAEGSDPPVMALVDKDHHVTWKGLSPGKWRLDFAPKLPGFFLKSPYEIEIGPEGQEPVEVVISSRGATVQGIVRTSADGTDPVEAATVLLISETDKQTRVLEFAISSVDGSFKFTRIPPGKYRLYAPEDIETNIWESPEVARILEGKGTAIELGPSENATHDVILNQP